MIYNEEKVLKALEICTSQCVCTGCPYEDPSRFLCGMKKDALFLIKQLRAEVNKVNKEKSDLVKEIFDRVKAVMFLFLYEHKPFGSGEYVRYFGIDLEEAINDLREEIEAQIEEEDLNATS